MIISKRFDEDPHEVYRDVADGKISDEHLEAAYKKSKQQHINPARKGCRFCCARSEHRHPDATGRLLFNMLGAIGQLETEIRAERQMDGIKKAKDCGVQFGKRPALTSSLDI